jgi:competence protein ComEC
MKKGLSKIIPIIILTAINFFLWQEILFSSDGSGLLTVVFLDIGEGDAILMDDSFGNQILIDSGNGEKILEALNKNMPTYDRKIELAILTHPDTDHMKGFLDVIEAYKVDKFLYTGVKKDSRVYNNLLNLLREENIDTEIAIQGQDISLANGADLYVLYPDENLEGFESKDTNDYSVITKLIFHNFSLLLTGDAARKLEAHLLNSTFNLNSTVLKVGHHGSKYSTHPLFLIRVNPKIAIISVGKNNYGHPAPEVLERLSNTLMLRTDLNGDIKIVTDGKKMQILPEYASEQ